jgi:hypothetical protein
MFPVLAFGGNRSIQEFGVLPGNTPEVNKVNLQKAIDWATDSGSALWVEPADGGYPVATGIILKKNVSLIGVHGPSGRGTKNPKKNEPVGSLFKITDDKEAFITVQSSTQIRGIQFWYPEQTNTEPEKIIKYKPTIQVSNDQNVYAVTLSYLTFYGEYIAMDFNSVSPRINELVLIEHCYGYPLSGEFIRIDRCYDIPRILHCHVNPSNMREFGRSFNKRIIDAVIANETYTYVINHTDNAQMMDLFTFGVYGGIYLGAETYGQLTNFNLDCVVVGLHKIGGGTKNRNWQVAQGSIIANTGKRLEDVHPLIIEGEGHTAITNVEAFSGGNGALTTLDQSYDYMLVKGDKKATISLFGCRMRNYVSDQPFTIQNPLVKIQAVGCVDKDENLFNLTKE